MIVGWEGKEPRLDPAVRMAENASAVGDVTAEAGVSLWYGAVVRGDISPIRIGRDTNIQDNAVIHGDPGVPTELGEQVSVGHSAVLHSCRVEDGCVIGMGAVVLKGCVIGAESMVAAGAVVAGGAIIPPGSLVVGVPGRVKRALTPEERQKQRDNAAEYLRLAAQLPQAEKRSRA